MDYQNLLYQVSNILGQFEQYKMDQQRKQRSHEYQHKKQNHDKHDKYDKQGLSQEEVDLLEKVIGMSANELYKFIDTKYDKVIGNSQKLVPKLSKAIEKKVNGLMGEFVESEKERMRLFVAKHTGTDLQKKDLDQIFSYAQNSTHTLAQNQKISVTVKFSPTIKDKRISKLVVSIQEAGKKQPIARQNFYHSGIAFENYHIADFKRTKRDTISYLDSILPNFQIIDKLLIQE